MRERDVRAGAVATARRLQVYGGSVGGVVLIVGALGVFAMQTLGLAERRREFEVRRALGASPLDLALQLLTESTTICILGSVCGLMVLAVSLPWFEWAKGLHADNKMLPWLSAAAGLSLTINVVCATWPLLREAERPPREALASN